MSFHPTNKIKRFLASALGILFCLALTTAMLAQRPHGGGFPFEGPGFGFPGMPWNQLELTEVQKTQIQNIREESRIKTQPIHEQLQKIQTEMQTAIQSGQSEDALEALAALQGELVGQLAGIQAITQARIYALLTPAQKEQQAKAMEEMKLHREQEQEPSQQGIHPGRGQ